MDRREPTFSGSSRVKALPQRAPDPSTKPPKARANLSSYSMVILGVGGAFVAAMYFDRGASPGILGLGGSSYVADCEKIYENEMGTMYRRSFKETEHGETYKVGQRDITTGYYARIAATINDNVEPDLFSCYSTLDGKLRYVTLDELESGYLMPVVYLDAAGHQLDGPP
jgi:hypothetical protein